jgi:hypothetical protein
MPARELALDRFALPDEYARNTRITPQVGERGRYCNVHAVIAAHAVDGNRHLHP